MRHLLLTKTILLLCTQINFVYTQHNIEYALKTGLNFANIRSDDILNTDTKIGYILGLAFNLELNDAVSFQPEIYYSIKGFKQSEQIVEEDIDVFAKLDFSLNYLEIPLLVVYSINDNINLIAGPYLDIFLNGQTQIKEKGQFFFADQWIDVDINETKDIDSDDVKSTEFGTVIGAEYITGDFSIGLRYSLGLTDIGKDSDFKHSVIQLIIGYSFNK